MTAWTRAKLEKQEKLEKEATESTTSTSKTINAPAPGKVSLAGAKVGDIFDSGINTRETYSSPVTPNSAFQIRNRMLSKMGAKVGVS